MGQERAPASRCSSCLSCFRRRCWTVDTGRPAVAAKSSSNSVLDNSTSSGVHGGPFAARDRVAVFRGGDARLWMSLQVAVCCPCRSTALVRILQPRPRSPDTGAVGGSFHDALKPGA
jgi:hypothetical protein